MKQKWNNINKPELIRNLLFLEIAFGILTIAVLIWNAVIAQQGTRHGFTLYFMGEIPKEFYIARAMGWVAWGLAGLNGIILLILCQYIKKHRGLVIATGILGIAAMVFGIFTILAIIAVIKISQSIKNGTIMDGKDKVISDQEIVNAQQNEVEKLKIQIEIEKLKNETNKK